MNSSMVMDFMSVVLATAQMVGLQAGLNDGLASQASDNHATVIKRSYETASAKNKRVMETCSLGYIAGVTAGVQWNKLDL